MEPIDRRTPGTDAAHEGPGSPPDLDAPLAWDAGPPPAPPDLDALLPWDGVWSSDAPLLDAAVSPPDALPSFYEPLPEPDWFDLLAAAGEPPSLLSIPEEWAAPAVAPSSIGAIPTPELVIALPPEGPSDFPSIPLLNEPSIAAPAALEPPPEVCSASETTPAARPGPCVGDASAPNAGEEEPDEDSRETWLLSDLIAARGSRALAAREPTDAAAEQDADAEKHLVFTVAGVEYAIPLRAARAVDHPRPATPLPHTPEWLRGVCNWRGDALAVVDARGFLGLPPIGAEGGRLLVVQSSDGALTAGLLVDGVRDVVGVRRDRVVPEVDGPAAAFAAGSAVLRARTLTLLDPDRLLRAPQLRVFEPV
jgi:purine-binding chemotaxis protein CheW